MSSKNLKSKWKIKSFKQNGEKLYTNRIMKKLVIKKESKRHIKWDEILAKLEKVSNGGRW